MKRGCQPVLSLDHPAVQHAILERVAYLMEQVPGLLEDEAQSVVRQSVERDAQDETLTIGSLYFLGQHNGFGPGRVRNPPTDYSRAVELVERRQLAAHTDEVERIYQQACSDMEALGLSFNLLNAYPRHRRALMPDEG